MRKGIFLDRDGTINVEKDYLHKIDEFEFEVGALEALKIFKDKGYIVIVVTNQSGIARGYYSEDDLEKLNNYMCEVVEAKGGKIEKCYFCPHHPEKGLKEYKQECSCRKPEIGMLEKGIAEFEIDREGSYMIGDKISDIDAGERAGLIPVLVKTGYGKKTLDKNAVNCEVYDNLLDFAKKL